MNSQDTLKDHYLRTPQHFSSDTLIKVCGKNYNIYVLNKRKIEKMIETIP